MLPEFVAGRQFPLHYLMSSLPAKLHRTTLFCNPLLNIRLDRANASANLFQLDACTRETSPCKNCTRRREQFGRWFPPGL